jgi:hypothetical protein
LSAHFCVPSCSVPRIIGSGPTIGGVPAHEKTPAVRRGFWLVLGLACLALIPPSSLPPRAGNAYEYALNTELYEAKQTEEGYVDQAKIFSGHLDTPTIFTNEDGNAAVVPAVEEAQPVSP